MDMLYLNCEETVKNTGGEYCEDLGPIGIYHIAPYGFSIPNADVLKREIYDAAIHADQGQRLYPFPTVYQMADNSEDAAYQDMPLGRLKVKDGKAILTFTHRSSRYHHELLKSHEGRKCSVMFVDLQNRAHGVRSGANFKYIPLSELSVKLKLNDGSAQATTTEVSMTLENWDEFQRVPSVAKGFNFQLSELSGLTPINLAVTNPLATGFTLSCRAFGSGKAFFPVGPTAEPLTDGDVVVKTSAGVVVAITSITPGTDTVAVAATLTPGATYTVDLYKPSLMVTKGYESTGAVTIQIPN